jgi:hypothetical protein
MSFGPIDADGNDNSVVYNWLLDAGVGAQIRVTDSQGNQVARLVTVDNVYTDTTDNYYNNHRIHIVRMYGNDTPSKAKIMITPNEINGFDGDYTADTDWARWYVNGQSDPVILSVYAENDELPLDMTQLWNFASSVVDNICTYPDVAGRQTAFYSQIDTLIANAFPPGTLYKDFEFYNNSVYDLYNGVDGRVTVNTADGIDYFFQISWDETHYWVKRDSERVYGPGSGYAVNDTIVVQGSYFGGEDVTNDLTITITEVSVGGAIKRWTLAGTPPAVTWPTNSVIHGGSYQENNANKFFTNYTGNNAGVGHDVAAATGCTLQAVPYNDGQVTSGEGIFCDIGSSSEYAVVYKSSVLGLFVTNNTSNYIETDGDSGSNSGHLDVQYYPHWKSYGVHLRVIDGTGSYVPDAKYKFTFDFNNSTGKIKFYGHNIYSEAGQDIWLGNFGGEGYVYIPRDNSLGYSYVEIANQGYTDPGNGIYNNGGVGISINNGTWRFRQDIHNNIANPSGSDNLYIANPNNTRTVSPWNVNCPPNVDTVVYVATADYVSSIKLFLMAEGSPDGAPQDWSQYWDTQSTDAIVVATPNSGNPNYLLPAITVYGRVYTGAAPVATFSVRRNLTTNRLEVLARPTATTYFCYVRATVTEIMTQD